jgi:hypothetical protein
MKTYTIILLLVIFSHLSTQSFCDDCPPPSGNACVPIFTPVTTTVVTPWYDTGVQLTVSDYAPCPYYDAQGVLDGEGIQPGTGYYDVWREVVDYYGFYDYVSPVNPDGSPVCPNCPPMGWCYQNGQPVTQNVETGWDPTGPCVNQGTA